MVDAADLKFATRKGVGVRVPSWAPAAYPESRPLPNSRPLRLNSQPCRTVRARARGGSESRRRSAASAPK